MRPNKRLIALTLSAVLLLSVVGPGLAMAQEDETQDEETELVVSVDGLTVSVVDGNESAVENATVTVNVTDENTTYAGAGDHQTDENGTVELPAPEETVNVSVTAAKDGVNESTSATLEPEAAEEDDEEGEEDEGDEGEASDVPFGQQLKALMNGDSSELTTGYDIATWVTNNNPGNAPDHAGPKDDTGPPEHAGPDGERGPPEHAGPGGDKGPSEDADAGEDDVAEEDVEGTEDGEDEEMEDEGTEDGEDDSSEE